MLGLLTPGMIFADDGKAYAAAIKATAPDGCEIVTRDGGDYPGALALGSLEADDPLAVLEQADDLGGGEDRCAVGRGSPGHGQGVPGVVGLAVGLVAALIAVSKGNDWGWSSGSTRVSS